MREIKFRAMAGGVMVYFGLFDIVKAWDEDSFMCRNHLTVSRKSPIMQYTGLKDNTKWEQLSKKERSDWLATGGTKENWNGKEIYEGDIVRKTWMGGWDGGEREFVQCLVVEFDEGSFITKDLGDQRIINTMRGSKKFWGYIIWEVIGNIWEHPHLLDTGEGGK